MKILNLSLLIYTILLTSIAGQDNKLNAKITYVSTIISNEGLEKEYLFQRPTQIRIDSKDNIYITDYHGSDIRVFSITGKYLKTLGRIGNGPGEYKDVSSFYIDKKDILYIWDSGNRRITKLDRTGKVLYTKNFNKITNIYYFWEYPEYKYLVMQYSPNDGFENAFYLYDSNFDNVITSFGHSSIFFQSLDATYDNFKTKLKVAVAKNGIIFVAKEYYDGNIYRFDPNNNWEHNIITRGKDVYKNITVNIEKRLKTPPTRNYVAFGDNRSKNQVMVHVSTSSLGLMIYAQKYLINFIYQAKDNNPKNGELGIEIFDLDGKFISYKMLDNENISFVSFATKIFGFDSENCFYMTGYNKNNGLPIVQKYKLLINE